MPGTCITNIPRTHRFGVSALGNYTTTTNAAIVPANVYGHLSNSHQWTPVFSQDEQHNGTPFYASEGVVYEAGSGSGSVSLTPRADDYRTILPLLLGNTFEADDIEPSVDGYCQFFHMASYKEITVFNHFNCKTSNWSLSSSRSQSRLQLEWGIESCQFLTTAASDFPTLTASPVSTLSPFVHTSSTLTIGGTEYRVDDVSITGNNNIDGESQFYNSTERGDLPSGMQEYALTFSFPFDTAADVALLANGLGMAEATFVYTAPGGLSLTIYFPALHPVFVSPNTPAGNAPVRHEGIVWTARSEGTGGSYQSPIKFTLDDTPA